jgi:deoxycytidine triphosphate deaminase
VYNSSELLGKDFGRWVIILMEIRRVEDIALTEENTMSFGVLLNNRLISKLVDDNELIIKPWKPSENLQFAQYALNPDMIIYEDKDGEEQLFDLKRKPYTFEPNEYVKVKVEQTIILPEGIVGRFIAASGLIEAGFGITVGKLDPKYGDNKETIQFGLKNLKNKKNEFNRTGKFTERIAYVEFFDLRNLPVDIGELRQYDYEVYEKRRMREHKEIFPSEY